MSPRYKLRTLLILLAILPPLLAFGWWKYSAWREAERRRAERERIYQELLLSVQQQLAAPNTSFIPAQQADPPPGKVTLP